MRLIDNEPLFDMDGKLLGHSRYASLNQLDAWYVENHPTEELQIEARRSILARIGYYHESAKGLVVTYSMRDRCLYWFWFQPF